MGQHYRLCVNGAVRETTGDGARPLIDCLREELRLTGTKKGCGIGACGSCTILVDGRPRRSCRLKLSEVGVLRDEGRGTKDEKDDTSRDERRRTKDDVAVASIVPHPSSIVTIEGLSTGKELHPIQQAFIDCGAIQCGFCTPGMVLTAKALLDANPSPTRDEIRRALAGNLCRCTGYQQIFEAIEEAARRQRTAGPSAGR